MKRKSESNRIRHSTPQHRRSVRRRAANRARIVVTVLGCLSLVIAIFFLIDSLWRRQLFPTATSWQLCFTYGGGALVLLFMRFLLGWDGFKRKPQGPRMPPRIDPTRSGMILLLTLILLGAISALALFLQHSAHVTRQTELRQLDRVRLRLALLDEGFARLQELASDAQLDVDHADKPWLAPREVERPDGIVTLSRIIDLNRFIDLNNLFLPDSFAGPNLTESLLTEVMTYAGDFTPIERLVAIQDWIDPDTDGIRESPFYLAQDPGYSVPNTWLHTWSELLWIEGFSIEYFEPPPVYRLGRPFESNINQLITIIPGPRDQPIPLNINTVSADLVQAIVGPDHDMLARLILGMRTERPFRSLDVLLPYLDTAALHTLRPFLDTRSTHFVLELQALYNNQRVRGRAIAERSTDGTTRIRQWVMN